MSMDKEGQKDLDQKSIGVSKKRVEDVRLLTGRAEFVGDIVLDEMLHVAFLRSPHAHAQIISIDYASALERDGVLAIYSADDMGEFCRSVPLIVQPPPIEGMIFNSHTQTPLAKDKVRYVGEPVAVIVAESRYIAEDALDDIQVEYEILPVASDLELSAASDAPQVHEGLAGNVSAYVKQSKGDYEAAKNSAAKVIRKRMTYQQGLAMPMETRGCVVSWDPAINMMDAWISTQAPTSLRDGLADMLGLSQNQVRVKTPFVGGGFGVKLCVFYAEYMSICWVSMQLGRPLRWIEDRAEYFVGGTQARSQTHDAEIAVAANGQILGVKDVFLHDNGAYNPYGLTVPIDSQCSIFGPYKIPNAVNEFTAVYTNKPIVAPYRGAGRQYGVYVIERLLDLAAAELNMDRTEIRRINYIKPDEFPYNHEFIFQDFAPLIYDSGQYEAGLDALLDALDYRKFIDEVQPAKKKEGRCVGIGVVSYIEVTGMGPYEGARVQIQTNGRVVVMTGVATTGQSHFTTFAQIASDRLSIPLEKIDVITGQADQFQWGAGTFGSRGVVVAGNAIALAADAVVERIRAVGAEVLGCEAGEVAWDRDGYVYSTAAGITDRVSFGDLARAANPTRGAVKPGTEPGLEATRYFGPKTGATASGGHGMIVEVDPDTMAIDIKKYVIQHDCGVVVNPLVVDGQLHGGTAQGIGQSFYEELVFNEVAQPLNATLADYLVPTANEVPEMDSVHEVTASTTNTLGLKGVGEAGAIPVGALFAQALEDALRCKYPRIEVLELPTSPSKLWELTRAYETQA